MSKYIPIFLILLLTLGSCSKRIIGFKKDLEVDSFDFQYLTARAKIKFEDGKKDLVGNANIRVQKDSAIWVSLSPGMGVEVARMLISRDSVYFIDRINKSFLKLSFEQISTEYDFEIDYHLIESIIIGNLIYPYRRESLVRNEDGLSYEQNFENYTFNNFIGNETRKLEKLDVKDLDTESAISVNYGKFQEVGDEIFPFQINATIEYLASAKQKTSIVIGFNKAQIGDKPLKFPFNVPSKYRAL